MKISQRTRDAYAQTLYTLQSAKALVLALLDDPAIGDVTRLDTHCIIHASAFEAGEAGAFLDWAEATRKAHFAALGIEPPPMSRWDDYPLR